MKDSTTRRLQPQEKTGHWLAPPAVGLPPILSPPLPRNTMDNLAHGLSLHIAPQSPRSR